MVRTIIEFIKEFISINRPYVAKYKCIMKCIMNCHSWEIAYDRVYTDGFFYRDVVFYCKRCNKFHYEHRFAFKKTAGAMIWFKLPGEMFGKEYGFISVEKNP